MRTNLSNLALLQVDPCGKPWRSGAGLHGITVNSFPYPTGCATRCTSQRQKLVYSAPIRYTYLKKDANPSGTWIGGAKKSRIQARDKGQRVAHKRGRKPEPCFYSTPFIIRSLERKRYGCRRCANLTS